MTTLSLDDNAMIETGGDGVPVPPWTHARIEQLARDAVANGHLVVHLHGGLVTPANGRLGASQMQPTYTAAKAFPVAFLWNTAPLAIVCNNLEEIAREGFFQRALALVLKYTAGRLRNAADSRAVVGFDNPSDLDIEARLRARAAAEEPYATSTVRPTG
ncbi:hypothetical protein [Nannocystis sp.]|uniref:hypothetical protein n=1 Tax=Nannocystis sp. TaxID=1962667 RepID=UPI0025F1A312|nr:hypothetical protein [Nannocystis sp.]MBK7828415.1 hypothetical protein [Nannocystis sp.]